MINFLEIEISRNDSCQKLRHEVIIQSIELLTSFCIDSLLYLRMSFSQPGLQYQQKYYLRIFSVTTDCRRLQIAPADCRNKQCRAPRVYEISHCDKLGGNRTAYQKAIGACIKMYLYVYSGETEWNVVLDRHRVLRVRRSNSSQESMIIGDVVWVWLEQRFSRSAVTTDMMVGRLAGDGRSAVICVNS